MILSFPTKENLYIRPSYFPISGIQHKKQIELIHKYFPFRVEMGAVHYAMDTDTELVNISNATNAAKFEYEAFKELADKVFKEYEDWCTSKNYPVYSHLYLPCARTKYWQITDGVIGTKEIVPSWVKDYLFTQSHVILTHNYRKDVQKTKRIKMQQELLKSIYVGDSDITPTEGLNQILLKYLGWCSANRVKVDIDFILPSPKNTELWTIQSA